MLKINYKNRTVDYLNKLKDDFFFWISLAVTHPQQDIVPPDLDTDPLLDLDYSIDDDIYLDTDIDDSYTVDTYDADGHYMPEYSEHVDGDNNVDDYYHDVDMDSDI